ncbi:unnamed protein product [Calypogeia fissa]
METDSAIILDPMGPPSPTRVSSSSHEDEAGRLISLNGDGAGDATFSQETPPLQSANVVSHIDAPEEEIEIEEEDRKISGFPEENVKQENNGLENSSTAGVGYVVQEETSDISSQGLEFAAAVQTQETSGQKEEAFALQGAEKQDEVPNVMDVVVKRDEIPANGDEQQHALEVASSQGGTELVKQEVAHRSHVLGSLSKLDENSARQLLNDSGWNVSQSVRMNGKTQWYYRSPPPKPVLLGSLTSAVALWKKLVDEDHKKKGGGEDDPYPMVTAFLSNAKRPGSKKRKRGRYADC